MDGNLGLTGWPLFIVKSILLLIIGAMLGAMVYVWAVKMPEQQAIIDKNEAIIRENETN